jgi:hypothetical protein
MQTGSSETLIGWKSGKTTYVPFMVPSGAWERGYGLSNNGMSFLSFSSVQVENIGE